MSREFDPPLPTAQAPRPPMQAWVDERTRVAVGRNTNIAGKLIFQEPVRIEGKFRGEVSSVELLVVTAEASIEGRIRAPRLLHPGAGERPGKRGSRAAGMRFDRAELDQQQQVVGGLQQAAQISGHPKSE